MDWHQSGEQNLEFNAVGQGKKSYQQQDCITRIYTACILQSSFDLERHTGWAAPMNHGLSPLHCVPHALSPLSKAVTRVKPHLHHSVAMCCMIVQIIHHTMESYYVSYHIIPYHTIISTLYPTDCWWRCLSLLCVCVPAIYWCIRGILICIECIRYSLNWKPSIRYHDSIYYILYMHYNAL